MFLALLLLFFEKKPVSGFDFGQLAKTFVANPELANSFLNPENLGGSAAAGLGLQAPDPSSQGISLSFSSTNFLMH